MEKNSQNNSSDKNSQDVAESFQTIYASIYNIRRILEQLNHSKGYITLDNTNSYTISLNNPQNHNLNDKNKPLDKIIDQNYKQFSGISISHSSHSQSQQNTSDISQYKNLLDLLNRENSTVDQLLDQYPDNQSIKQMKIQIFFLYGYIFYFIQNVSNSIHYFYKAYLLNPVSVDALYNIGSILYSIGKKDQAQSCWLDCLRKDPTHQDTFEILLKIFCKHGDFNNAHKVINMTLISIWPPNESNLKWFVNILFTKANLFYNNQNSLSSALAYFVGILNIVLNYNKYYEFYVNKQNEFKSHLTQNQTFPFVPTSITEIGEVLSLILLPLNEEFSKSSGRTVLSPFPKTQDYLLSPHEAVRIASLAYTYDSISILKGINDSFTKKCIIIYAANSLVNIAKILQDNAHGIFSSMQKESTPTQILLDTYKNKKRSILPTDLLSLYYLALHFSPSANSANNIGVILASLESTIASTSKNPMQSLFIENCKKIKDDFNENKLECKKEPCKPNNDNYQVNSDGPISDTANSVSVDYHNSQEVLSKSKIDFNTIVSNVNSIDLNNIGSGTLDFKSLAENIPESSLALRYYKYGLALDCKYSHIYSNIGSYYKDRGLMNIAIGYYIASLNINPNFDVPLSNLANVYQEIGNIEFAIQTYVKALSINPSLYEAIGGLTNLRMAICDWKGRGSFGSEKITVDDHGYFHTVTNMENKSHGYIGYLIKLVSQQYDENKAWNQEILDKFDIQKYIQPYRARFEQLDCLSEFNAIMNKDNSQLSFPQSIYDIFVLINEFDRLLSWKYYQCIYEKETYRIEEFTRSMLPEIISAPTASCVIPFHTFTYPLPYELIDDITIRTALKISYSVLEAPWLPKNIYPPPFPPMLLENKINVGYVSSDFKNHPLAHLMCSVFGMHNKQKFRIFCYSVSSNDNSEYRAKIKEGCDFFRDVFEWPTEQVCEKIVQDKIHLLINLNGYTRGARNEIFAARPAPINISLMGFPGSVSAPWNDYLVADPIVIGCDPTWDNYYNTGSHEESGEEYIYLSAQLNEHLSGRSRFYREKIICMPYSYFCCDHKQSAKNIAFYNNQENYFDQYNKDRMKLRKEYFPNIPENAVLLGNFNQLYKIDPSIFNSWLTILKHVTNAYLILLRFPAAGEHHLKRMAERWEEKYGLDTNLNSISSRIIFTSVADKFIHISRSQVIDLLLDTPECNGHTTSADILWTGTPLLVYPRYRYKFCSRVSTSILWAAVPRTRQGYEIASLLTTYSEEEYVKKAIMLANERSKLDRIRYVLHSCREDCSLFDTLNYTRYLEKGYESAWNIWESGYSARDIFIEQ